MMGVLKWSVRIHKWVALIVGIQIMLWIAGGLVMSAIPIEQVRGEHKIAATESLAASPADLLALEQVTDQHEIGAISEAVLGQVLGAFEVLQGQVDRLAQRWQQGLFETVAVAQAGT